ncbi:MAG: disulfide bond formation protein B [Zoogloeaceae bacterium]|nr:disulfide bond formation protein B [Zoogloeaceae bacterium]
MMRWLSALSPRARLFLLGCPAFALLAASLALQSWENLHPCPLCIFQRFLYMLFGVVAFLGAALPGQGRGKTSVFAALLASVALAGLSTAIYQTLMQARPDLVPECSYTNPGPIEQFVNWIGAYALSSPTLSDLFLATGTCDSQEWAFLGLSMPNWSAICFLAFLALSVWLTGWLAGRTGRR